MTMGGLHIEDNKQNAREVEQIIKTFFLKPTFLKDFNVLLSTMPKSKLTFAGNIPKHKTELNNMGNSNTEWRIYLTQFSTSQDNLDAVARTFNGVCIQDCNIQGNTTFKQSNQQCNCCRGRDHPSGLCPLKSIPGFFNNNPSPLRSPTSASVSTPAKSINALGAYAAQNTNMLQATGQAAGERVGETQPRGVEDEGPTGKDAGTSTVGSIVAPAPCTSAHAQVFLRHIFFFALF